ncbi:MAG: type I restriction endonuclease subunit R [Synergistaceae bacterium]|nr:type I restriction endonuclease subunit R [Synergistaceae bacterium]
MVGFDAQILQVMYLDKPMKNHGLIQAVCRTNRTYDGKTHGLVVDYVGVFDNAAESLKFDESEMKSVIQNIEEVNNQIPDLVKKCMDYFPGVDINIFGLSGLELAQKFLYDNNKKDSFGADYRVLNRAWDYVSPDKFLLQYEKTYCWLSRVYASVRPSAGEIKTNDEILTLDGYVGEGSRTKKYSIYQAILLSKSE